ncbi:MAG: hypothetical protein ACFB12_06365 [Leptolyngbyaceae cyanobacterium]
MAPWVKDPHGGGTKVPKAAQERIRQRILQYAEVHYAGKYNRLDVRFRSQFCYIDAYVEPNLPANFPPPNFPETREECLERMRNEPLHLCRLRYFGDADSWSFAFYTYSNEKYEPCMFRNGTFYGTPEEAFQASAMYLE